MKKIFRFLKKLFKRTFAKHHTENSDPFASLEAKGLKIAESSKRKMYSPWGIDKNFPWLIEIGEECTISTNVFIIAHDASTSSAIGYSKVGRITIGNRVYIGHNSTILCGVSIGDNAIIGANSLVNRDVPANTVYAGNPAKYICSFEEYRSKREKEFEKVPCFDHNWYYWSKQASAEERAEMYEQMKESRIAYIQSNVKAIK